MAHKTVKDISNQTPASTASPTHVYDRALKSVHTVDSHRRLLHARKNEPKGRWWSSWHDHLLGLLEARQGNVRK
jgi:hypothetical protein